MHIDLVNPTLNATRFANAHTQIMSLQMQKTICIYKNAQSCMWPLLIAMHLTS